MKKIYFLSTLIYLCNIHCTYTMNPAPDQSTNFVGVTVQIPLTAALNPSVAKKAHLQVPSTLVAEIKKNTQSEKEILTQYIAQRKPELLKALGVFTSLLQNKSKGPITNPITQMAQYDTVLFGLLTAKPTNFFFLCDNQLVLDWPIGEHGDGWNFNITVRIQQLPNNPQDGTSSPKMIEFENKMSKERFSIAFHSLEELYIKARKKPQINRETVMKLAKSLTEEAYWQLHEKDVVDMALHYLAHRKNNAQKH